MTGGLALRGAALVLAAALGHGGPRAARPVAGFLAAVAVLGVGPARLPGLFQVAFVALALAALQALILGHAWPPLAGEGAETAALFGLPILAWGAFVLRGSSVADIALAMAGLALVVAVAGACGVQAAGEAGWRRPALFLLGVTAGAGAGTGFLRLAGGTAPASRPFVAVGGFVLALLAFVPAFVLEGRRVLRELGEEARLGLLPAEDVESLARPWLRVREPRFGRRDERRTYVRSALLLAVALQQQRRRSGDAERLRQLEVLTFRTRVRRTLEARNARTSSSSDELQLPA